jgi:CBS domain-containing protein
MGDVDEFATELARHVAIMQHFDRYKLSVHTGSDKFSIYPIVARHADGRVHVKPAGTSYLEALRLMAQHQVRRLPVVEEDGRLVGILAQADIARQGKDEQTGQVVQEISE